MLNLEQENEYLLQKKDKHVKALEASAAKTLSTLNARTERFTNYREKKEAKVYLARQKAKKSAQATDKKHLAELKRQHSKLYKAERDYNKSKLALESDLELKVASAM